MADYYTILGLEKNATSIEIKTAFRKLAKIYHPDKNPNNPNAKSAFEEVLKAYNTLINIHSRKRYDKTFDAPIQVNTVRSNSTNKTWSFNEDDLKRRQYYKTYYQTKQKQASPKVKTNYSDYKNMMFATPLAIGLLMIIISMFSSPKKSNTENLKFEINIDSLKKTDTHSSK